MQNLQISIQGESEKSPVIADEFFSIGMGLMRAGKATKAYSWLCHHSQPDLRKRVCQNLMRELNAAFQFSAGARSPLVTCRKIQRDTYWGFKGRTRRRLMSAVGISPPEPRRPPVIDDQFMFNSKKRRKRWCVKHLSGWCACALDRKPEEDSISVKTACGHYITLPFGFERRLPTCDECTAETKHDINQN